MYIFLDIDGVLNKQSDWTRPFSLNPECVNNFLKLISGLHNVKVVLSSTWRNGISRDGTRASHVEDLMMLLETVGIKTIDKTGVAPDGSRSKEIDHYLRRHDKDSYIILDDDASLFEEGKKTANLYLTNNALGLTLQDVKKISKMAR